jgi:hypothetical protein
LGPFRVELKRFLVNADNQLEEGTTAVASPGFNSNSILSAVSNLFVQYEFAEMSTLPPTELRNMLNKLTDRLSCRHSFGYRRLCLEFVINRFSIGDIADSNEALDAILQRIHTEDETCPEKHKCLSHTVFGGCILEQSTCQSCRVRIASGLEVWCRNLQVMAFAGNQRAHH